jgi:hypothetical protein
MRIVNPYIHGGGFSPSDVSGLILWLDATDLTTLWQESTRSTQVASDGDPVGAWDDKSGNGNHWTQATAGDRPVYKEDFNTSYAGILKAADNDMLDGSMSESSGEWTMFFVLDQVATGGYIIDFQTGRLLVGYLGAVLGYYDGSGWRTGTEVTTSPCVTTVKLDSTDSTSATIHVNQVSSQTTAYTERALGGGQGLFNTYGGGIPIDGYIASVLIYTGVLSAGDISSVEDYLADRYGITF